MESQTITRPSVKKSRIETAMCNCGRTYERYSSEKKCPRCTSFHDGGGKRR